VDIFDKHPQLLFLQPPFAKTGVKRKRQHDQGVGDASDEGCAADFEYPFDGSECGISSRYMLMNRTRLAAALPFKTQTDMFGGNKPGFESTLGRVLHAYATASGADGFAGFARMVCDSDSFVIHPPVKAILGHNGHVLDTAILNEYTAQLYALDKTLLNSSNPLSSDEWLKSTITEMTQELIQRIEGGMFVLQADSITDHGQSMASVPSRISHGFAW